MKSTIQSTTIGKTLNLRDNNQEAMTVVTPESIDLVVKLKEVTDKEIAAFYGRIDVRLYIARMYAPFLLFTFGNRTVRAIVELYGFTPEAIKAWGAATFTDLGLALADMQQKRLYARRIVNFAPIAEVRKLTSGKCCTSEAHAVDYFIKDLKELYPDNGPIMRLSKAGFRYAPISRPTR